MKKVVKVLFIAIIFAFFGCSNKVIFANIPLIDKKPLFNLSSLSVETSINHIDGEKDIGENLSNALEQRAKDSIYFTGFQKGILKLKIEKVEITKAKERNGNFLYFFPSYDKWFKGRITYTISAYSPKQEELASHTVKLELKNKNSERELVETLLSDFQDSLYKVSKNELAKFAATR
jgi:hypothetical protein